MHRSIDTDITLDSDNHTQSLMIERCNTLKHLIIDLHRSLTIPPHGHTEGLNAISITPLADNFCCTRRLR